METSLVAQGMRICLLTQRTQVRSLVWEDSMWLWATKPVRHSYWAWALEPLSCNSGSLHTLEPVLCNKRSHGNEKPVYHNQDPAQPKINELILFLKKGVKDCHAWTFKTSRKVREVSHMGPHVLWLPLFEMSRTDNSREMGNSLAVA